MKKINLKKFAIFLEKTYEGLKVTSINRNKNYNNAYDIHFDYSGELRTRVLNSLEDQIESSLGKYTDDISVMIDHDAPHTSEAFSHGLIEVSFIKNSVRVLLEKKHEESVFVKKFKEFINHFWDNDIEQNIIKQIYKYRIPIIKDANKGKEYLQELFKQNQKIIESNCSKEFKDLLIKLINEYKTEDEQLNELQSETKDFNKKNKKIYSDSSYFGESKNKKMKNKTNLGLIKRVDEFFYISENEQALKNWENYKHEILKESNVKTWEEYSKKSTLTEEINMATGLIKLHNLTPRAEQYLNGFEIKENYLYRPTKDYCFKVGLNLNPYADKEGNIFFDNEEAARGYADNSKGKYEYVGKESVKEAYSKKLKEDFNNSQKINQPDYKFYVVSLKQNKIISGFEYVEDAKEYMNEIEGEPLKVYSKQFLITKGLNPDNNASWGTDVLNEDMTTAAIAVPDVTAFRKLSESTFDVPEQPKNPEIESNQTDFEKRLNNFDPYKNVSNIVDGSTTKIKKLGCLTESYSIKKHNLNEKKTDKFTVCIQNNYKEQTNISFNKKDFAKFIFENCDVRNFIKEGKFDYYKYINSKTYGFTNTLIKEFFKKKYNNVLNKYNKKTEILKETKKYSDYNNWKNALMSAQIKTGLSAQKIGKWDYNLNEGVINI